MSENEIEFIKLNDKIKSEYLALQVCDFQKDFIETPMGSLKDMETKAWNMNWEILCIFANGQMVGYLMHGINKYNDVWLDRFMIDKHFQNKGYGSLALSKIIIKLKDLYPQRHNILLSVESHNIVAIKFYEKFGFHLTGQIEDGELVMKLDK